MAFDFSGLILEEGEVAPEAIVNGNGSADLAYLDELRRASRPTIEAIARGLSSTLGLRSEISEKSARSTLDKCARPALKARCPWFTPAHIRDYLRFRTHLQQRNDFEKVLFHFKNVSDQGLVSIVKVDFAKLARPGAFGWRMVATDLRVLSTGLIVEHYMTFSDMIAINEDWLHALYEKWRIVDTDTMSLIELETFERDRRLSFVAYREFFLLGLVKNTPLHETVTKGSDDLVRARVEPLFRSTSRRVDTG